MTDIERDTLAADELKEQIKEKEAELENFVLDEDSEGVDYNEWLDGLHEGCDFCSQYGASRILAEVDPVAYRCGLSDYLDGLDKEDFQELEDLQSELEDLEQD